MRIRCSVAFLHTKVRYYDKTNLNLNVRFVSSPGNSLRYVKCMIKWISNRPDEDHSEVRIFTDNPIFSRVYSRPPVFYHFYARFLRGSFGSVSVLMVADLFPRARLRVLL
jgi:hypothetical protein